MKRVCVTISIFILCLQLFGQNPPDSVASTKTISIGVDAEYEANPI
jgi:hypothetical protein